MTEPRWFKGEPFGRGYPGCTAQPKSVAVWHDNYNHPDSVSLEMGMFDVALTPEDAREMADHLVAVAAEVERNRPLKVEVTIPRGSEPLADWECAVLIKNALAKQQESAG